MPMPTQPEASVLEKWPRFGPSFYEDWRATRETLHRWTQVVGKIRLSKTPWVNHGWHCTLYVTERGLTTSLIHDEASGTAFTIDFDFVSHVLEIRRNHRGSIVLPLLAEPVAAFHDKLLLALKGLGIQARIHPQPNEIADTTPLNQDRAHCSYEPEHAHRFWRALLQADRVMKVFRSKFVGKASPVHFFWGSFDLAVTRFSGRRAPEHPGGVPHLPDLIAREAYSHEVSSCGFWPGNDVFPQAAFYSYAYPAPEGFGKTPMPAGTLFEGTLRELVLPYDALARAADPDALVLDFFRSAYEGAARLGRWDRESLEHSPLLERLQAKAA
jgi:hypothetical protein